MKFRYILLSLILSSCASILSPRKQTVIVNTNNENATVLLDLKEIGKGKQISLILKKDGKPKNITIKSPLTEDKHSVLMQSEKSKLFYINFPFLFPIFFDGGNNSNLYADTFYIERGMPNYSFNEDSIFHKIDTGNFNLNINQISFKNVNYEQYQKKKLTKLYSGEKWTFIKDGLNEYVDTKKDLDSFIVNNVNLQEQFYSILNDKINKIDNSDHLIKLDFTISNLELYQVKYEDVVSMGSEIYFYVYKAKINLVLRKYDQIVYDKKFEIITDEYLKNKNEICRSLINKSIYNLYIDKDFKKQIYRSPQDDNSIINIKQNSFVSSLGDASKSTVTIKSKNGHGSGFFIGENGEIITNCHVVATDQDYEVVLKDGTILKAEVLRKDFLNDLALLKCSHMGHKVFDLKELITPQIGQEVYAIGTPTSEELNQTISKGIFSGKQTIKDINYLQTDASINGGNSGGPMIDKQGNLLGVVVAKIIAKNVEGIGFCIPSQKITKVLNLKIN